MPDAPSQWTVRTLLAWAKGWLERKGVESPRLDAELLLAHALQCDRVKLYVDHDKPLSPDELGKLKPLLSRRAEREPVAHILGKKEFYGRSFAVGPGVFVPRPETELLVQHALEAMQQSAAGVDSGGAASIAGAPAEAGLRALDLCAGSGAIGVTLAAERADLTVDLVEMSPEAAVYTRKNAAALGGGRAHVFDGDLYAPLGLADARYAAIVSNPPYIPAPDEAGLAPEITRYEPRLALYAGARGLDVLQNVIASAPRWLRPGGFFGVEIDPSQAAEVVSLCAAAGLVGARVVQDLSKTDRFVLAKGA